MSAGLAQVERYITPRARSDIADAIAEAGGNEVFFLGRRDEQGLVDEVEVHCRGHKTAVPALLHIGRHGEVVIHNHPSGGLFPSDPDLALASHYGQEGVGFYIVANDASAVYVVVEAPSVVSQDIDIEAVETTFVSEGALPAILPGYEPREQQLAMARGVAQAQNEGGIQVVEAGTGTGKSLAYLLPSAMRALANGERVAVATRTIHLQQQLLRADAPIARQLFGAELEVSLLKGRGNYLCKRKLEHRLSLLDGDTEPAERQGLLQIGEWAETTSDGSLSDLPFVPDRDIWESVQSNTEHTLRVRCPHYESCFYYASRRTAARAQLLLVNHHLLLADLALKAEGTGVSLLPKYEHVVLDEAHHLEDVATDFAGTDVTTLGLLRQLGRLRPTRGRKRGIGMSLLLALDGAGESDEATFMRRELEILLDRTESARAEVRMQMGEIAHATQRVLEGQSALPAPVSIEDRGADSTQWTHTEPAPPQGPPPDRSTLERRERTGQGNTLRLEDDLEQRDPRFFTFLVERTSMMASSLTSVARAADAVAGTFKEMPEKWRRKYLQSHMDLISVQRRVVDGASALTTALAPAEDLVRWIELRRGRDDDVRARFVVRPIEVGELVRSTLVAQSRSLVMTSATLSVDGSFDHFRQRCGLSDGGPVEARTTQQMIASPFDYASQVLLGLPTDIPEPGSRGYEDSVVHAVTDAISVAGGRTFVLFTSYGQLRRVADRVGGMLGRNFRILRQGDLPRDQLLRAFGSGTNTALFGTDSFWEGVDVRGDALSCVILPRLPFRVPSEPVQVARAQRIEERGGNPFSEMSVPQAVLKFRQGFGRLVRHRHDRGVVLVLDRRITTRRYGGRFIRSLPGEIVPIREPTAELLGRMSEFLRS
ncbi:MAG: helicase [Deltaproteobacteria bacterium]|nr:helicase [Deltaproteobacteria bacterium]